MWEESYELLLIKQANKITLAIMLIIREGMSQRIGALEVVCVHACLHACICACVYACICVCEERERVCVCDSVSVCDLCMTVYV